MVYALAVENLEPGPRKEFDTALFEGTSSARLASDPAMQELQDMREQMRGDS